MLISAAIVLGLAALAAVVLAANSLIERQPVGRHRPGTAPGRRPAVDITGELVLTGPAAQLALEGPKRTLKPGWQLDFNVPLSEVERAMMVDLAGDSPTVKLEPIAA